MITKAVKELFEFINFLHGNINFLLGKQHLIDEVMELHVRRNTLKPMQNYKERLEYNKIQEEIIKKFDVIKKDTCDLILSKVEELKIATTLTPVLNLKAQADLFELTKSFDEPDLLIIFEAKRKYFDFRQKTNCDYFLQLFFHDLDRDLKEFFDYFRDSEISEFSFLNAKTANVTNLGDIGAMLKQGKIVKMNLGHDFNRLQMQPIHTETTLSLEDDFKTQYRKVQQMGNTSIAILRSLEDDGDFMSAFLQEFAKAPQFADVLKYWRMFYTEAEIEDGFQEMSRLVPNKTSRNVMANYIRTTPFEDSLYKLQNEFEQLIAQGKIPDSCLTHNIQNTNIYKQLKIVEALFNNFKEMKSYNPSQNDLLRQAEEFGQSMIREIEKINYKPIRRSIIEIIISDTDNIYMYLPKLAANVTGSSLKGSNNVEFSKDYKMAKMYLDNYLSKYISQQTNSTILTEKHSETMAKKIIIERKPIFNEQAVQFALTNLKDFFSEEHQFQLALILKTGGNAPKKLFFRGAGNRLTDTFKKLYEHDFIVGCQKQDLINWIIQNFEFQHNDTVKTFLFDSVEKIISRKGAPCKTPLIEIVDGKIQKAEQPKRKSFRK